MPKTPRKSTVWRFADPLGHNPSNPTLVRACAIFGDRLQDMPRVASAVLEAMRTLIGDPVVHVYALIEHKTVREDCGVFKLGRNGLSANLRLSEIISTNALEQLPRDLWTSVFICCSRGHKQDRHAVWELDISAPGGYMRSTELELLVDRAQLDEAGRCGCGEVSDLLLPLFRACTVEPSFNYGYSEIRRRNDSHQFSNWRIRKKHEKRATFSGDSITNLRDVADHCWWCHQSQRGSVVPGVFWVNVLSAVQIAKMGGSAGLAASMSTTYDDPEAKPPAPIKLNKGAYLVSMTPLKTEFLRDYRQDGMQHFAAMLLTRLAQAGLLVFQHVDWIDQSIEASRKYTGEAALYVEQTGSRPEVLIEDLRTKRPRCIGAESMPIVGSALEALIGRYHDFITAFQVVAAGGGRAHTIAGVKPAGGEGLASPIIVGGMTASRAALCFDQRCHGWEGEQVGGEPSLRNRRVAQFTCGSCQGRLFEIVAAFEYPDDLGETLDRSELEHAEDFFTWFWVISRCASCGHESEVADIECA